MTFVCTITPPPHLVGGPERWVWVKGSEVMVAPEPPEGCAAAPHYLGHLDGEGWWAAEVVDGEPEAGAPYTHLFGLAAQVSDLEWTAAGRAVQIVDWDRCHRFCGRCATPTDLIDGERARKCPSCGLMAFPRLAPAVIVLIENDRGQALLARNKTFAAPMFSALAGFVEPGETMEQAVHREVKEEVGVDVTDVTYLQSQPWPFPHSLMIGFTAKHAGGEIEVDGTEIAEARWFDHDDLPMIPPGLSIARRLIDGWIARVS